MHLQINKTKIFNKTKISILHLFNWQIQATVCNKWFLILKFKYYNSRCNVSLREDPLVVNNLGCIKWNHLMISAYNGTKSIVASTGDAGICRVWRLWQTPYSLYLLQLCKYLNTTKNYFVHIEWLLTNWLRR